MNPSDENERPSENQPARATAQRPEPAETEQTAPKNDSADFRELAEGGYGWGV